MYTEMAMPPADSGEVSMITKGHIDYLRRRRKIPSQERVEARVPGNKRMPEPRADEYVVFGMHFNVGFRLPVSRSMRQFLEFYSLYMHHLGPNFIMCLSSFTMLCKDYKAPIK
ncbi:hypothetical protein D1007_06750 [Hordeum vulgare]|nr:hypothetical protein D1007_06750 [Hordeum vulgare]